MQFVGPIQQAWLERLERHGVRPVQYIEHNAYLVWADAAGRVTLEQLAAQGGFLQYSGPYHPYYKLGPSLREPLAGGTAAERAVPVTIQILNHAGREATEQAIAAAAISLDSPWQPILVYRNLQATVPLSRLAAIAALPDVTWIGERFPRERMDEVQGQILAAHFDAGQTGPSGPGYKAFLDGLGFSTNPADYPIVDVTDDGIGTGSAANGSGDPTFTRLGDGTTTRLSYVGNCTSDPLGDGVDGHGHINTSIVGGYDVRAGSPYRDADGFQRGMGMNPYGRMAGTKIFLNYIGWYDNSACGGTDAGVIASSYGAGARISSNSWGCAGCAGSYDEGSQAYDAGTRDALPGTAGNQQLLFVFAAGNSGPGGGTVGTPGNGKNMLTVGASENDRPTWYDGCGVPESGADNAMDVIDFSSRGPAPGGRRKPEIIAPGTHIQGTASTNADYTGYGVCDAYQPTDQTVFAASSGTSHSTPAVSGIASLDYRWLQTHYLSAVPSPALLKAYVLTHTTYLTGLDANDTLPSNTQGYGMPNLTMAFDDTPRFLLDQSVLLTNSGETWNFSGSIANGARPVRVVLAYTDAPGALGTSPQVNNLNLRVTVNGVPYLGNVFSGPLSVTGGAADNANNYEAVFLPAGTSGTIAITVTGFNIAGDGVPGTGDATDQDFALVCYNCATCATLPAPSAVAPPDGASGLPIAPVLDWSDVAGAASYDVQVATDAGFAGVVRSASGLTSSTWTVSPPLATATTYYWRARAVDGCGPGAWSAPRSFTTCLGPPAAPSLIAPAQGAVLTSTTTPTLDWSGVAGAATYDVQVASDAGFAVVVRAATGLTASSWTVAPGLTNNATYYWRARAAGTCGAGAWSASRSFNLGCVPSTATYDPARRAPSCAASACGCGSGTALDSRDTIAVRTEANQPNTINGSCADGTFGTYHSFTDGESVDRITVKATDGLKLKPGGQAQIDVTVWCRGPIGPGPASVGLNAQVPPPSSPDYVDVYYASNASSPVWTAVAQGLHCTSGGSITFTRSLTLSSVTGSHAVRAQIRNLGVSSSCTTGSYNDHDDLVFRVEPVPLESVPLDAGYAHSVSVHNTGSVWAWGLNQSGQLGDGTLTDRNGPVRSGSLTNVVAVAAGVFHTVALDASGNVFTWGGNAEGQLGDGGSATRIAPFQVPGLTGVVAIAAGGNHTLAVTGAGAVYAWGDNSGGQLGNGNQLDQHAPVLVGGLSGVVSVAGGFYHSIALKSDGTVFAWGRNAEAELGDGTHTDRLVPGIVPGLSGVKKVGSGAYFNLALLQDGTLRGWGHNFYGQLGLGHNAEQTTPAAVADFGDVTAIAPGSGFSLVLKNDGTVWSCGQNVAGQLGDGTLDGRNTFGPVTGLSTVVAIAAGEDHSLARLANGQIYGWGKNLNGQIGAGPWPQLTPVFITDQSATPPLALMSPTGGERWEPGSNQTVRWTGAGPISVELSIDGGTTWTILVSSTNAQDVAIVVPGWTTARGKLRINRVGSPPSSATTGAPMKLYHLPTRYPWLGQSVDATPEITGEYGSIALDGSGRTWIAYFDRTSGNLKLAHRSSGGWAIETVDADPNVTGYFTALAIAADGSPRISYVDGSRAMVRYAYKSGLTWTLEDVADTACTLRTSLALDSTGRAYIALQDCQPSTQVRVYGRTSSWAPLFTQPAAASPSLRLVQDRPRVAYFSSGTPQLHYLSASGNYPFSWSEVTVAGTTGADFESLAVDGQDNAWISFYTNASPRKLRLVKRINGAWSAPEDVDASAGDVGNYSSIALDAAGRPRIAYHANGLLRLAEWNGASWDLDVADAAGETGTHAALAIDASGNDRIAHFDAANGNLRYSISQPDVTPPAAPVLSGFGGRTTVAVSWTGSGDDGTAGAATSYEARISGSPFFDFGQGTPIPVSGQCASTQGLGSCSPYYVAVRALDDLGNESPMSTIYVPTDCSGGFLEVTCE
ncbi:MAG TPA: S8 family serine peptidase [Candidatus Polarisedimenticolaceae bacterium]|nr:S8 family serine peptidase [Candidatus Polarisedimenticolaceae bacterium]